MIDHVLNFIRLLQVLYIRSSKINNQEIKPTLFNCYITKLSQKKKFRKLSRKIKIKNKIKQKLK